MVYRVSETTCSNFLYNTQHYTIHYAGRGGDIKDKERKVRVEDVLMCCGGIQSMKMGNAN